ncbi:MAG: type I phosphomannose isomerase catalytic subunit [Cyclobacteriaceae bacterium]
MYPLKFKTIYKDKIWGGNKIKSVLNKDYGDLPNCGETWEISGVKGNVSVVDGGQFDGKDLVRLIDEHKGELVGESVYQRFGNEFPLLIKFIDANDDLSIQVHPDDALGKKRHNSFGKTEMWYVVQADKGSSLIAGFSKQVDKKSYLEYFNAGKLTDILNKEEIESDDVFFIPAGRVHTIGKGLLIAEIQQTSDITYRIYDFDRKDDQGNTRELHVEEALDAIDYNVYPEYKTSYSDKLNEAVELASCQYFETNKLLFESEIKRDYTSLDSFVSLLCLEGNATLICEGNTIVIKKGDVYLIPARMNGITLVPTEQTKIVETYVPAE